MLGAAPVTNLESRFFMEVLVELIFGPLSSRINSGKRSECVSCVF